MSSLFYSVLPEIEDRKVNTVKIGTKSGLEVLVLPILFRETLNRECTFYVIFMHNEILKIRMVLAVEQAQYLIL